jgi:hypothetical protein
LAEVADIQSLMERAEASAHAGDFVAAEESLRLAVELQERTLGASSPEVASTLNNLGIVYERLNRPEDAEASYRKSFAIAKAAFDHDHPLVETSATNLREFCDARGIPFEQPTPAVVSPSAALPAAMPDLKARPTVPAAASASRGPLLIGAAVVALAIIAMAIVASRRSASPVPSGPPAVPPAAQVAEPAPAPAAVTPETAKPAPPSAAAASAPAPSTPAPRQTAAPIAVEVIDAHLCQSLDVESNWRCNPLPESTGGGPVFFVTRVKAERDTSVEHRWYRNDKLIQSVSLTVRATGSGYRTYSRTTTGADRAGTWRVELRGPAGTVLAQKTFTVGPS